MVLFGRISEEVVMSTVRILPEIAHAETTVTLEIVTEQVALAMLMSV